MRHVLGIQPLEKFKLWSVCLDGLWSGPKAKDADLWILIWKEFHRVHQEGILVEAEHVKAHRSEKEETTNVALRRFVTEGDEKADEYAKDGAVMYGRVMAQIRASTVQQKREEAQAALQYAASFSLFGGGMARL